MPIFEYRCWNCGKTFEKLMLGAAEAVSCPVCGNTEVEKLMSPGVIKSACEVAAAG
jgi:putative FmdB family regulatory protein